MTEPIACPACMHEETVTARVNEREPCPDHMALMEWVRPYGGARGQQVTRWDGGAWVCRVCGLRLSPRDAAVLLDAALFARDPYCDSRDEEGYYADSKRAAQGGPA